MEAARKLVLAVAGETFDSLARTVFGDERRAAEMMCVNPELSGVMVFSGGEPVFLPVLEDEDGDTEEDETESAPWRR